MKTKVFIILILMIIPFECGLCAERIFSLRFSGQDAPPRCYFPHKFVHRPKICLALSGGGARGLAQIGVFQAFEENDIPIDFIVGVSMGSIVGGLYAAGYSPAQIHETLRKINWDQIVVDTPPRTNLFIGQKEARDRTIIQIRFKGLAPVIPQSLTAGQRMYSILTDLTMRAGYQSISDFDDLKIPFRALACDLISGQKIILREGDLAEAMRASATFPLLISPVHKDGMLLVDGGLINNLPVDEVNEFDVDLVIVVDTTSKLHEADRLQTPWIIADQVTSIMQREKLKDQRKKADILIQLDMEEKKSDDFVFIDELVAEGYLKAMAQIDNIRKLLKVSHQEQRYFVKQIEIEGGLTSFDEKIIPDSKDSLLTSEIYTILENIYHLGLFSQVDAEIDLNDHLIVHVTENPCFEKIVIKGNTIFPDSLIYSQILSIPHQPINYFQSRSDIQRIINLYREKGYSLARIQKIDFSGGTLEIDIDEGTISEISVSGNQRTKAYVIMREFRLKPGDIFNIDIANEGITDIHSTGLFTNVSFSIKPSINSYHLNIKVLEKPFSIFRMSARYDLKYKGSGFIELSDDNFFGSGNSLTLHGLYGFRNQSVKMQFRADRVFRSFLASQFDISHTRLEEYTYSKGKQIGNFQTINSGFSASIGQQIKRLGKLSFIARVNSINLKGLSGEGYPVGKMELKTLAIQSIVDTQNKYPFPTHGKYYKFFYEISSARFLNSQESFFKIFSCLESYYTFGKRNTIHQKISWGTSDLTTPFSEQFRLGGIASFYGLQENEFMGRHLFLSSLEYRYQFPFGFTFDVYWSIRYNLGATWQNAVDIKPGDFNHGIGTALSASTFWGPITLAYGTLGRGRNVIYFSAGYDF